MAFPVFFFFYDIAFNNLKISLATVKLRLVQNMIFIEDFFYYEEYGYFRWKSSLSKNYFF